jgi:hypothetical protein
MSINPFVTVFWLHSATPSMAAQRLTGTLIKPSAA